jgi:predicted transcriptional regulator
MAKREELTLSDDTHAQITKLAEDASRSVHAWIVAAVEREAFRQLCEKTNQWWKEHPEEVARTAEDFRHRQEWRTEIKRGSAA